MIGPSHHGYLTSASSIPWETPLGIVDTDTEFIGALDIGIDEPSHEEEHSIEVQMPFIKYRFPRSQVVPVMMGEQDPAHAAAVVEKIVAAQRLTKRDIRIVASSDFSHYVPEAQAKDGDLYAIEALTRLDVKEFYRRIREKRVTACGYGPISVMVSACLCMGARAGKLIRYGTSGDVTGRPGRSRGVRSHCGDVGWQRGVRRARYFCSASMQWYTESPALPWQSSPGSL